MMARREAFALLLLSPVILYFGWIAIDEFQRDILITSQRITLKKARKREKTAIELEFPLVVELFAILIGGGMSPSSALARMSENGQGEFHAILLPIVGEMKKGMNLAQALDLLNKQIGSPIIRRFCDSLAISIDRGSSVIDVVGRQVEEVRQRQRVRHQGGSKVRPVEGRSCSAALKSEDRRPKPERRPKSEFREWPNSIGCCSDGVAINSDLGLRVSFGLRSSGLGSGMARTDFRAARGTP